LYPRIFHPDSHQSNSSQSVPNSITFSTNTASGRCTSAQEIMSRAVARVRSKVSGFARAASPSSSSSCWPWLRRLPPAGAISVQIGEPARMRVRGMLRLSVLLMSATRCSAIGWFV